MRGPVFHEVKIVHANDLYRKFFTQATWALKRMWFKYTEKYEDIWQDFPSRAKATSSQWQKLIQSRHYVMALVQVLRDRDEWNEDTFAPRSDSADILEVF